MEHERIGVAVSGGADSIYLLHELLKEGFSPTVLHVNHGLRGEESDGDERFVRELAEKLGLCTIVHRAHSLPGNVEQGARDARYEWFRELIRQKIIDRVALGHTKSDQAETVLFRFLRGAGTAGLAGIRPEADGLHRPLLGLTREQIRQSLRERGIAWREDSSNQDPAFARNRIRQELIPRLEREWNPAISEALAQTAEWALAEESYWTGEMARLEGEFFRPGAAGLIVRWPGSLHLAARRRLVRQALQRVKGELRQVDFGHIEAILALRSGRVSVPGLTVERSFEWLRIFRAGEEPGFEHRIRLELLATGSVYNKEDADQLDWDRLSGPLDLRNWQPGDRYRRAGRSKEERLKLLFQEARIPVWERRSWPVLICGNNIAWARDFGVAAELARTVNTRRVLLIRSRAGFPNRKV